MYYFIYYKYNIVCILYFFIHIVCYIYVYTIYISYMYVPIYSIRKHRSCAGHVTHLCSSLVCSLLVTVLIGFSLAWEFVVSGLSILLLRVVPDQLLVSQSMRAWQGIWGKHAAHKWWCPLIRKYSKMITFMCYMVYNNTYVRRGAWPNKLIHMRKKAWPGSTLQLELYGKLLFYGMNGMWVALYVCHACDIQMIAD